MDFRISRLHADQDSARYHLFNEQNRLILVADHGSPWLPPDLRGNVRFARPNGELVAKLHLSQTAVKRNRRRPYTDYAIILNHAVYAIIQEYHSPISTNEHLSFPYFILNVEGLKWLALKPDADSFFALYDRVPFWLGRATRAGQPDLPRPVGHIAQTAVGYDFTITFSTARLNHSPLISLALIFLIDYNRLSS